jgi:hypothetical protein
MRNWNNSTFWRNATALERNATNHSVFTVKIVLTGTAVERDVLNSIYCCQ